MLKAYYDRNRFSYIENELNNSGLIEYCGSEKIKKTACFYSENFNVYIDSSDGVNMDLSINEYCGRIFKILEETDGKPFLYFKSLFSTEKSEDIIQAVEDNNGKILPFFIWPNVLSTDGLFYSKIFPRRESIREEIKATIKKYDIGFFCGLSPYTYPKASNNNSLVSWCDTEWGSDGTDMGQYSIYSRKNLYDKMESSNFNFLHKQEPYDDYLKSSYECKTILNSPGINDYTSRVFEHCFLGNCIVLRKTTYDFGFSWKDYIPELDFESDDWENKYQDIIDNYEEWGDRAKEYFDLFLTPEAMVDYFVDEVEHYRKSL